MAIVLLLGMGNSNGFIKKKYKGNVTNWIRCAGTATPPILHYPKFRAIHCRAGVIYSRGWIAAGNRILDSLRFATPRRQRNDTHDVRIYGTAFDMVCTITVTAQKPLGYGWVNDTRPTMGGAEFAVGL